MSNLPSAEVVEMVLLKGDLSKLNDEQRLSYYKNICESLGLNPLTKPFEYIPLNGRLVLYARRDATDQLRRIYKVSVKITARETANDCHSVTAQASLPDGRCDESVGVVQVGNLKGMDLANALMKAETKAKRRVTLSICGLGMFDETEIEGISAQRETQRAEVSFAVDDAEPEIPKILSAQSAPEDSQEIRARVAPARPYCCEKPMVIDGTEPGKFICTVCRTKAPRPKA